MTVAPAPHLVPRIAYAEVVDVPLPWTFQLVMPDTEFLHVRELGRRDGDVHDLAIPGPPAPRRAVSEDAATARWRQYELIDRCSGPRHDARGGWHGIRGS